MQIVQISVDDFNRLMELVGDYCASGEERNVIVLRDLMREVVVSNPEVLKDYQIDFGYYPVFVE